VIIFLRLASPLAPAPGGSAGCVGLGAGGLPCAPFTAALRQLVRARGAAQVAGLLPGQAAGELGVLLPGFGTPPAGGEAAATACRQHLLDGS
jgi:hypothetical protein